MEKCPKNISYILKDMKHVNTDNAKGSVWNCIFTALSSIYRFIRRVFQLTF